MEKECIICGKFFKTDNPIRKCCDDCSEHYNQRKREYTNAYAASKRRMWGTYEPEVIEKKCDGCGKTYKTIHRLLISWDPHHDDNKLYFCTDQCKWRYAASHTYCSVCGKSMENNGRFSLNNSTGTFYCCDECETKGKWEIARRNGEVKICIHCGKEYISKGKYFCGNQCYQEAVKAGWRPEKKEESKLVKINLTCIVCGKTVTKECNPKDVSPFRFICSNECRDKLITWKKKKADANIKKNVEVKDLNKVTTALCADCRVSYKDCERMQSEFRVLPKGAHYNNKGILVICPKYQPPKKRA